MAENQKVRINIQAKKDVTVRFKEEPFSKKIALTKDCVLKIGHKPMINMEEPSSRACRKEGKAPKEETQAVARPPVLGRTGAL